MVCALPGALYGAGAPAPTDTNVQNSILHFMRVFDL